MTTSDDDEHICVAPIAREPWYLRGSRIVRQTAGFEGEQMATNKAIVESVYAAFATGNVPAVLGAMDDKIEWTEADGFPLAGTYVGPQAVLENVFMRLGEIGDDFAAVPNHFVADGDTVVALGTYTWKNKASGEPAEVKMAHVWTLADGKVSRFQQHVDTARVRDLIA
jgi:ketosteroid isomerase-like protein